MKNLIHKHNYSTKLHKVVSGALLTITILLITLSLTSCVNVNHPIVDAPDSFSEQHPNIYKWTEKRFAGVPFLLALEGSSVRYNHEYILTNKHNSFIFALQGYREDVDIHYHPDCDLALVKDVISPSEAIPERGKVFLGERVVLAGYPIGSGYRASEGVFIGDVISADTPKCKMSASDAGMIGGMSGGGVWNTKGELVGVVVGHAIGNVKWERDGELITYKEPAMFISLLVVQDWIDSIVEEGE